MTSITHPTAAEPAEPVRSDGLPGPVGWAIAIECLVVALDVLGQTMLLEVLIHLSIGAVLVIGLYRGWAACRQLVMLGAGLTIGFAVINGFQAIGDGAAGLALLLMLGAFVRGLQINKLIQPAAKRHFGFDCPACGSLKVAGASLLYDKRVCKSCDHRWAESTAERTQQVDVAAFD